MKRKKAGIFLFLLIFFCAGPAGVYPAEKEVGLALENLHWLGHDSFRWDASRVIYLDPWKLSPGSKKADIILITHEHFDHFSLEDLLRISTPNTVIVGPAEVIQKLSAQGKAWKEARALSVGDSVDVYGINILAVPSYNLNKAFHPKSSGKLGYVVTSSGVKVYHAGDTDFIPEMKGLECDIALLPVSGTYVMTAEEAAEAALAIRPGIAVPMHFGDIVGTEADAQQFRDRLAGKIEVKILTKEGAR